MTNTQTATMTTNNRHTIETRIIAALAEARKARHHRDCQCQSFDKRWCNAADALWSRCTDRLLSQLKGETDE